VSYNITVTPIASPDSYFRPYSWSTERYLALLGTGIIPEDVGVELVSGHGVYEHERFIAADGEIEMPQLGKTFALAGIFPPAV